MSQAQNGCCHEHGQVVNNNATHGQKLLCDAFLDPSWFLMLQRGLVCAPSNAVAPGSCRPEHKPDCKLKTQQQLRVDIRSEPPGSQGANSWSGVSPSDIARYEAGRLNGIAGGARPKFKNVSGNIAVKNEKLFDVKIQVIACKLALYITSGSPEAACLCFIPDNMFVWAFSLALHCHLSCTLLIT